MVIKIIGAGLFGCSIGYELNRRGHDVTIIEQDNEIMQRASKCNHNRLHLGYHYPRSIETAKQSLDGLLTFLINYKEAIVSNFPNVYLVAKENSKVTAEEFIAFCEKVNISHIPTSLDCLHKNHLVDKNLIDLAITTDEPIFDYEILKSLVKKKIKGIDIKFNMVFDGRLDDCDYLINTTYAGINTVSKQLGIPEIKVKLQDVFIPCFKMDSDPFGLTLMDGPFCSVIPRGNHKNEFLLYSVQHSLIDRNLDMDNIYKQSEKYFPFLKDTDRLGFWRTLRVIPENKNDQRLSEIYTYKENPKVISVLSGKISTCHKIGQLISRMICR